MTNEDCPITPPPEPEGPTKSPSLNEQALEEVDALEAMGACNIDIIRRALARCGRPVIEPEPEHPSDKELLELMPETMRDQFSYAAQVCSDATGGQVKPGIFRVALNTVALEYAQAILAHYTS